MFPCSSNEPLAIEIYKRDYHLQLDQKHEIHRNNSSKYVKYMYLNF